MRIPLQVGVPTEQPEVDDRINILLVDDRRENLLILEALLRPLAQNLFTATSGTEALKLLLERQFAVVLLDVQMPEIGGIETAALIREREGSRDTPIIFVTAGDQNSPLAFEGYTAGAVDYLFKPLVPEVLRAKVSTFVHLAKKSQALEREIAQRLKAEAALEEALDELGKRINERTESLRESQALFRDFMNHSPAVAFIRNSEERLIYVNEPYERFYRASAAELAGRTLNQIVPDATAEAVLDLYRRVMAEDRMIQEDHAIPSPDGDLHDFRFYAFPIVNAAGERFLGGFALDVSEQVQLQQQLLHAQKMEAVGRLAGGVAHDFNNMLAVILGYSELALARIPPGDLLRGHVEEVKKAGQRATTLTRQLLAFSRRQMVEPRHIDLNETLAGIEGMLNRLIGEDVDLSIVAAPAPAPVLADPGQIEQVVLNLVVNARDAMPTGGKVTLEVSDVHLDETYAREHTGVAPGDYVMLAVSDTGQGMDAATRARIFEPFFTTKEQGKGTGLGLSTVFGIVKQSGGNVWVYSEPEHGTTFKIYLPRTQGAEPEPERIPEAPRAISPGSETVLLLEDDLMVRNMVRSVLQDTGFTVVEAAAPEEALRYCAEHSARIDVLLTDVVMPRMSGREVAEQLRAQFPHLKVLYMSGYTDDAVVRHGVLNAEAHFIQKPFSLASLTRKLREVLDE